MEIPAPHLIFISNTSANSADVSQLAIIADVERMELLLNSLKEFYSAVGFRGCHSDNGVRRMHFQQLIEKVLKDTCIVTNPHQPVPEDIQNVYESAL